VGPEWIVRCLERKKVVLPSGEFVHTMPSKTNGIETSNTTTRLGVAWQAARLEQAALDHKRAEPLLSGCTVVLCGAFENPNRSDVQVLIKEAGGSQTGIAAATDLLRTNDSSSSRGGMLVLLCDDSSKHNVPSHLVKAIRVSRHVRVVNTNWLFDSIACGTLLRPALYPPSSAQARELWDFTQSQ